MTPKTDPLGLRYSQCQEFLPEDDRTLFDEFEGRFKIDRVWRTRETLRLERTYKKAWALLPLAMLILLLSGTALAFFFGNRVAARVAIQLPIQFLMIYLFLGCAAYETLTRKFSLRVDAEGIQTGKQSIALADVEGVELGALLKGWPRTYVRLLRPGRPPEDVLRARGALSAFIVHGALSRMLESSRQESSAAVVGAPGVVAEAPASGTHPGPAAAPKEVWSEAPTTLEPEVVSKLHALAMPETALGRDGYGDRAFRWSFRKQEHGWQFRCRPQTVFRPLRPAIFGVSSLVIAVVLFGNGLWLPAVPLVLIGMIAGLVCLRGASDRKAEVSLAWRAGQLHLERYGSDVRSFDPALVLSVEPEERGERVWLRIQLPDGPEPVAAALQVEPILQLREHIISTLEGATPARA